MKTDPPLLADPHQLTADELGARLGTDLQQGLASAEVGRLLAEHGPNELPEAEHKPWWRLILRQFASPLIYMLFVAAVIAFAMNHASDAVVILVVVLVNAAIGAVQEGRAEHSMSALRRMSALKVRVVRDGEESMIEARDLVPGDLLLISAGDAVGADARLLEAAALQAAEAALTGESLPVVKHTEVMRDEVALGDRGNMIHAGTHLTAGCGRAVVVATGLRTEVGKIARLTAAAADPRTPLELRLHQFGQWLVGAAITLFGLVLAFGLLRGIPFDSIFIVAISQMVSMVPERLLQLCDPASLDVAAMDQAAADLAAQALRVLAVAVMDETVLDALAGVGQGRGQLRFLGLVAQTDPPRGAVMAAVAECRAAGIRPVMVTGDHKATGLAIATALGIARPGDMAVDGGELELMPEQDLRASLDRISVFARVHPAQKLRMVEAFQSQGQVVAMTGGGVNDAPALATADVGVAMGLTGTEVAKGAAKIIISDDNFATIVKAVEEGRLVYQNLKKVVLFLFVTSLDEVLELARWGCLVEDHYSAKRGQPAPMDLEWAKDAITGELFIVQVRPETVQSRRAPHGTKPPRRGWRRR